MSRRQPTEAEARDQVERIEGLLSRATLAVPIQWQVIEPAWGEPYVVADGFWLKVPKSHCRTGFGVSWPVSDITARCTDCGKVLRDAVDRGRFFYDGRWLTRDASVANPELAPPYDPHHVCIRCFGRVRHIIAKAKLINENRLLIGRLLKEVRLCRGRSRLPANCEASSPM